MNPIAKCCGFYCSCILVVSFFFFGILIQLIEDRNWWIIRDFPHETDTKIEADAGGKRASENPRAMPHYAALIHTLVVAVFIPPNQRGISVFPSNMRTSCPLAMMLLLRSTALSAMLAAVVPPHPRPVVPAPSSYTCITPAVISE